MPHDRFIPLAVPLILFLGSPLAGPLHSWAAELPPEQPLWPAGFDNPIVYDQAESVRQPPAKPASPSGSNRVFSYVSKPTYAIHRADPERSTGVGLVICPGGGYRDVWLDREGHDLALVLKQHGITSLVLKYRTSAGDRTSRIHAWETYLPAVETDARKAISTLREQADDLNLDREKIGICGFSAGGNLAILATFGQPSEQQSTGTPNFAGLFYPWLREDYASVVAQNGERIPPLFIMNAVDDRVTPADKCIALYQELLKAGVSAELHLYSQGRHGFDLGIGSGESTAMWPASFVAWLKDEEFIQQ